jgi:hypothetical protein
MVVMKVWASAILACLELFPGASGSMQAPCPDGREKGGDLGIAELYCEGGPCRIYERDDRGYRHEFSIEPRLVGISPDGPSARLVRESDALVAIDGVLVTTPEGGRRLAQLVPGRPVELWLRRGADEIKGDVTPRAGCGFRTLRVRER